MNKTFRRMFIYLFIGCAVLAGCVIAFVNQPKFGASPTGERLERMKASPNYKSGSFQNLENTPDLAEGVSMVSVLWNFLFTKTPGRIPSEPIPHVKTDLSALDLTENTLVWFGHSSYYLQVDGRRLLVDPVFSGHASPVSFTTKSFPGANSYPAEEMPDIDYLVITHDHWDHLDYETVKKLQTKVSRVICPLGVGAHLERWGYPAHKITELDWNESTDLATSFSLTATPARHFSGRSLKRNGTLWASFVLQTPSLRIYIGGDSGYGKHFAQIGQQFGPFDLVILENGQYNQNWPYIHMLPNEVLIAAKDLNAKNVLPVHNSKFSLAMHTWDAPLISITQANEQSLLSVLTPMIGQAINLQNLTDQPLPHWWESPR